LFIALDFNTSVIAVNDYKSVLVTDVNANIISLKHYLSILGLSINYMKDICLLYMNVVQSYYGNHFKMHIIGHHILI